MYRTLSSRFIICALLIIILPKISYSLSIPVIDFSALLQRISLLAEEIAQWEGYKTEFDKFYTMFREHESEFAHYWGGFYRGEIDDIRPDLDLITDILNSPLYRDIRSLDPWRIIFNHLERINMKFKYLEKDDYVMDNWYDRTNRSAAYRNYREEIRKKEEREVKNLKALLKKFTTTRKSEEAILKRVKHFDTSIHRFSLGLKEKRLDAKTMASQEGKLKAIQVYMKADQLMLNLHILSILRTHVEEITKDRFSEIDTTNHLGTLNQESKKNSDALKKFLRGKK